MPELYSKYLGILAYSEALHWQRMAWQLAYEEEFYSILALEHYAVITTGQNSPYSEILMPLESITNRGFEWIQARRGGQASLHNPGQLVIYPIFRLRAFHLGLKDYISLLLKTTADSLRRLGIHCEVDNCKQVGAYTNRGKIAFIGLKIEKGVCLHGISINISNALEDFSLIRSCGVKNAPMDRVLNYCDSNPQSFYDFWYHDFKKNLLGKLSR